MIDLAVIVLILCFAMGLLSSFLFTVALYLYQMSRPPAETAETAATVSQKQHCAPVSATSNVKKAKSKALKKTDIEAAAGDGDAMNDKRTDEDGSTTTTSYTSCERCSQGLVPQRQEQQQEKRRQQQQFLSSWTEDTPAGGSAGIYTCELCGSCCAGDSRKTYRPMDAGSIDAELCIDRSSVRFRRCRTGVGAYFFNQNGKDQQAACGNPVSAVSATLSLPAETGCMYHLRFCTTNGELHSAKINKCCDCRSILCFELIKILKQCPDGANNGETILFVNRLRQKRKEFKRSFGQVSIQEIDSWLVAILTDSVSNEATIAYSGMTRKFVQIARQPDSQLVLQLCLQAQQTQCLEPYSNIVQDCDDQSAQGDLGVRSPISAEQLLKKQQQQRQQQRHIRRKRHRMQQQQQQQQQQLAAAAGSDKNNCEHEVAWDDGASECSNSLQADTKSSLTGGGQSPLSMGSMRRAVRWPITQMESLMETSSSSASSPRADSTGPNLPAGDAPGDVAIRLEEDAEQQGVAPDENSALPADAPALQLPQ
ncbi:hypothetical protein BOX15_Mlig027455g1 [Macrostomum lignano]|uniref:Uncharacterized protein n=1 Tax=Macrostomum lignano TaxID=282301 RepID=A0A267ETN6_9PLAT|nr:hypothetical protein BOX15_Mlig027455g2 [Macrostomum lignano]PAA64102.1 hypothetical protein BOX15_Mlig027455g1 [Macrostomum lignano]